MANKRATFLMAKDVATPYVINTTHPAKPRIIKYKRFKAGDMVTGEVHMKGDKPDFLLVAGRLVVPINCVKELMTKEMVSNADGKTAADLKKYVQTGNPKVKYADAAIVGGIIGFCLTWLAEEKGLIKMPDKKNKIIGGAIGAALFAYIVYRIRTQKVKARS